MRKEDEWIKKHDCLIINGTKVWFSCAYALAKKTPNKNNPSMQLVFNIYKDGVGWLRWNDFKNTYLAEKLTDYVNNSLNGQRNTYWDYNKERDFH